MKSQFKLWSVYLALCGCLVLSGCSNNRQTTAPNSPIQTSKLVAQQQQLLVQIQQEWQGTPYKLGGTNKQGVDCSAFVQHAYERLYNSLLPRTTEQQLALGISVSLAEAQTGDLIFFRTSHKVRHVGVIYDQDYFLHASTSQGVIFSRLDNPYWSARILLIKRPFI
jgi:cell wall-associated NlpC family hydrolase